MNRINRKELKSLIDNIENEQLKQELMNFTNKEEVELNLFFEHIKKLDLIDDLDYNIMLLLEEFYLRFKDIG